MNEEFRKRLEATFHEEASDHLQHLGSGLIAWEKSGEDAVSPLAESLYRAAHSLKGAARAVGYLEMESLCQAMEGAFAALRSDRRPLGPQAFDVFNGARSQLERMLSARRRGTGTVAPDPGMLEALKGLEVPRAPDSPPAVRAPQAPHAPAPVPAPPPPPERGAASPGPGPESRDGKSWVRIPVAKLDALGGHLDGLVAAKSASMRLAALLDEVRDSAAALTARLRRERKEEVHGGGREADPGTLHLAAELQDLADRARRLGHGNRDQLDQVAGILTASVKDALMIPLGDLLDPFPRMARDLAMATGKRVQMTLAGADREMEKSLVDPLRDILLHLVRNAVDHGIETPAERRAAGKPEAGRIELKVDLAPGGRIALRISDDGRGLDPDGLRAAAVRAGHLEAEASRALTGPENLELAFLGGLSTRDSVSTLSGRGLGLAIARERVHALGGAISLESVPGRGATFLITLPSRRVTARGVVVAAGGRKYVIPTSAVRQVLKSDPAQGAAGAQTALRVGEEWLEVTPLAALLGGEADRPHGGMAAVLITEAAGTRRAYRVEALLGEQEIAVQPLGPFLEQVGHVTGAAQLLSGEHALVLDLAAVSAITASPARPASRDRDGGPGAPVPARKRILVVEDSITSRTLIKSLLETAGYAVSLAVDGLAAWNHLEKGSEPPDAVVSDVEMPNLDGFELLARIRASAGWRGLPVVLVTSLSSPVERARGLSLGANGYMAKGEFDAGLLLRILGSRP